MATQPHKQGCCRRAWRAQLVALLLQTHRSRLMHQARFHSRRPHDAEDAINDACLQFLRFYDGPPGDTALHWMLLVVKRCAWAIGRGLPTTAPAEQIELAVPDDGVSPAEAAERAEETEQVVNALQILKADERIALILVGLGFSYAEIRELRGWSPRKVRRCLDDGRARVRKSLREGGN